MKIRAPETFGAVLAASAVFNGTDAFLFNNQAIRADAIADTLYIQGHPNAGEYAARATHKEEKRNAHLLMAGSSLMMLGAGITIKVSKRNQ